MSNLVEYVRNETRSFAVLPFGDADSMVLAALAYMRFERIVSKPSLSAMAVPVSALAIAERMEVMLSGVNNRENVGELMHAVAASRRFCRMTVNYAVSQFSGEDTCQFAAVTFFLDDNTAFVAFRGTDNTIVGWRENFNMAYKQTVPAQESSVKYLEDVAWRTPRALRVGGHSKGGNLAVYAATTCSQRVQDRITGVYCLDGPGFKEALFEKPEYLRIKDRVTRLMPTGSLIGTLLNQSTDYRVVNSDGEGFDQHSLHNWRFDGPELDYAPRLSDDAVRFDRMLDKWVASLSDEQLEGIVKELFDAVNEIGAESFNDVLDYINSGELTAAKAYRMIDPENRRAAAFVIAELGRAYIKTRRIPKK